MDVGVTENRIRDGVIGSACSKSTVMDESVN